MSDRLYNLHQLIELSDGNMEFVKKMARMFTDMAAVYIIEIQIALRNEEYEKIGNESHKMKPSIDMMGIVSLKERIRELEQWGKNRENIDRIPVVLKEVVATLDDVCDQLKEDLKD